MTQRFLELSFLSSPPGSLNVIKWPQRCKLSLSALTRATHICWFGHPPLIRRFLTTFHLLLSDVAFKWHNTVRGEQNSSSGVLEKGRPKMGTWPLRAYSHPAADPELYQRHKWLSNSRSPAKIRSDRSAPCCWGRRSSLTHLKVDEGISRFILSSVIWQHGLGWVKRPDDFQA